MRHAPIFSVLKENKMKKTARSVARAAIIAAAYFALCHLQNLLLPGSATWAIQFRVAEALCVLTLFTTDAIYGLSIGCLLFNVSFAGALPLDFLVGPAATALAAWGMYLTRKLRLCKLPILALLLPALCNGLLIGWELTVYVGGGFLINSIYVAIGEAAVLLTLGAVLYGIIIRRQLHRHL